jgi:glutamate/tyrosine decarboxylase-like PLP-dependent enzyme
MTADRLELSREEMRKLGYEVVDTLVEHFATLQDQSVGCKADRPSLMAMLDEPAPRQGTDPSVLLERLKQDVFPNCLRVNHPRFFAFVPSAANFVGAMADALASGFNVFAGTWMGGSAAAAMELVVTGWLREFCGLPESAAGLFVSGGSMANLTALVVARHSRLGGEMNGAVVYLSDQTHSCVDRALSVIGFRPEQIRKLAAGDDFRLPASALREAIARDRAEDRIPFCLVANAGTTNTGAVDPLEELAELCRQEGLWLHVDGAYGAAAAISARGREALRGLELADSISLDPHKWLFQPFESGCVLVRDGRLMKDAFRIMPEYLRDVHRGTEEVHFCDRGVQLTRSFRALKLWLTIQTFGREAIETAVDRGFRLAEYAEARIREMAGWEIATSAQMGIVTFRNTRLDNEGHHRLVSAMLEDGYAFLTSTTLKGQTVLRLCTVNPRTTESDIDGTLVLLETLSARQTNCV